MKSHSQYILTFLGILIICSCEKSETATLPISSLNITNAIVGGAVVKLGSNATSIPNNSFAQLVLKVGENNLYIWPDGDSLHPYYIQEKLTVTNGEVYSLFLAGPSSAVDAVAIKENIPYRTDSTAGIRFINLANNNGPLTISLSTTPTVNEATDLAYKSYTDFKTYPGLYNSAPVFQIKNSSGTVLTTFAFTAATVPRFANVTMVIRQNGPGVAVFRVNNDR
jgi:hypothetical protein